MTELVKGGQGREGYELTQMLSKLWLLIKIFLMETAALGAAKGMWDAIN